MKTKLIHLILMALLTVIPASGQDRAGQVTVSGRIVDAKTHAPVDYASVSLSGTNISNVTNSEGVFTLKIPKSAVRPRITVSISHLGYAALIVKVDDLAADPGVTPMVLKMTPVNLQLDAATVKVMNASDLISAAYSRIKDNYAQQAVGMTAFYREIIKKGNAKYLSLNEAIIDINKAPCRIGAVDRTGIYKGRGSLNYNATDSLLINYQGGVVASLQIDQVVNPFAGVYMSDLDLYYDFQDGRKPDSG